jgi:hypothetical protein
MKIDSTTWCSENNQAGKYLADTLTKIGDEKLAEKVSVYFHRYRQRIKGLTPLDKKNRSFYLKLLLNKTKQEIEFNFRHELVKSLLLNIISTIHKQELLKINLK